MPPPSPRVIRFPDVLGASARLGQVHRSYCLAARLGVCDLVHVALLASVNFPRFVAGGRLVSELDICACGARWLRCRCEVGVRLKLPAEVSRCEKSLPFSAWLGKASLCEGQWVLKSPFRLPPELLLRCPPKSAAASWLPKRRVEANEPNNRFLCVWEGGVPTPFSDHAFFSVWFPVLFGQAVRRTQPRNVQRGDSEVFHK